MYMSSNAWLMWGFPHLNWGTNKHLQLQLHGALPFTIAINTLICLLYQVLTIKVCLYP
jgi:hypothetical protein